MESYIIRRGNSCEGMSKTNHKFSEYNSNNLFSPRVDNLVANEVDREAIVEKNMKYNEIKIKDLKDLKDETKLQDIEIHSNNKNENVGNSKGSAKFQLIKNM